MPLSHRPRRTLTIGWFVLGFCIGITTLGASLSGANYAFGTRYSVLRAISLALTTPLEAALHSRGGWIAILMIPTMAMSWLWYAHASDGTRQHRKRVVVLSYGCLAIAGTVGGGFLAFLFSPIVLVLAPLVLVMGPSTPENFQLGLVCWYGVGLWIWFLMLVHHLDSRRPRTPTHLCQHCGYSRTGLAHDAACPECGQPPTIELRRSHHQ